MSEASWKGKTRLGHWKRKMEIVCKRKAEVWMTRKLVSAVLNKHIKLSVYFGRFREYPEALESITKGQREAIGTDSIY